MLAFGEYKSTDCQLARIPKADEKSRILLEQKEHFSVGKRRIIKFHFDNA